MMSHFLKVILLQVFLCTAMVANTQSQQMGTWNVANVRFNINKQWSAWTELQARSHKLYDQFYYHELKGGFQYNINSSASVLLGAGQYATYSPGGNFKSPVLTHEFRFWQQLALTNNIDRLKLEHRYRIEQRWLSSGYRNRYRYRLSAILPFNHNKMEAKTFYLNVYDEIFLTNTTPHFERNRFYAGAGFQFTNAFTLQLGALKQYDYRANGTAASKVFFQTALFFVFSQHPHHASTGLQHGSMD